MQEAFTTSVLKAQSASAAEVRRKWALGSLLAAGSAAVVLTLAALTGGPANAWAASGAQASHGAHAVAVGWGGGHHHGHHGLPFGGRHLERMLDKIDATPAQREQIKPIVDKAAADLKALHAQGVGLHEQGIQLWAAPRIDAAAAEQLRQRVQAHHDKVGKRILQATIDVGNVLTPEQRAKVAEHLKKRHEKMKERMQHHHRHHRQDAPGQAASAVPQS